MTSRGTKWWMLGMAAAFALLGLVLKLTDLHGRQGVRRTGEPASAGEGAATLARDGDRLARVPSSPTDVAAAGDDRRGGRGDARAGDTRTDVAFDGGDTAYETQAQVEVPDVGKITGAAGTMSFWLEPGWQEGNQDDATLMNLGDGRLQIIKNVGFLRFEFVDDGGGTGGLGTSIADWREGESHQVTATWNGDQYALDVDGQLGSQTVHNGQADLPSGANLHIGSNFPEGRPVARGTIGSVDLHNRPLGPGEVAGNFNAIAGRSTARATP